jgi:hypothetical protein
LLLLLCSSPVLHLQRFSSRILVCCFFLVLITILLVVSLFSPSSLSLCLSVCNLSWLVQEWMPEDWCIQKFAS